MNRKKNIFMYLVLLDFIDYYMFNKIQLLVMYNFKGHGTDTAMFLVKYFEYFEYY